MGTTPGAAAEALLSRARHQQRELEARAAGIRVRLPAAARRLRDVHGATRVVLFGSLAWGGFHDESDVDLAVQGVSPSSLSAAAAELSELLGAPVELCALEDLPSDFARRIAEEGIPLP